MATWNKELVHTIVDEATATRIFSIPLAGCNSEDLLVWKFEGSGEYTVKSGYWVLTTENLQQSSYTSTNVDGYTEFYKSLWVLHLPAKIKIHIWRLFHNFLPHFCNLTRRTLRIEVACLLCKVGSEDSDHLIWSCGILQYV